MRCCVRRIKEIIHKVKSKHNKKPQLVVSATLYIDFRNDDYTYLIDTSINSTNSSYLVISNSPVSAKVIWSSGFRN